MVEGKIFVVAKKPILSREASENYEKHKAMWDIFDYHNTHGGSPVVVGVVTLDVTEKSKQIPRYKIQFPDGTIDYVSVHNFNEWYDFKKTPEESKNNNITINITVNIENKESIENAIKEIETKFKEAGRKFGESFKKNISY